MINGELKGSWHLEKTGDGNKGGEPREKNVVLKAYVELGTISRRAFRFPILPFMGVAEAALYCAHRATTVSSWGLCEQEGHLATPLLYQSAPSRSMTI